MSAFCSSPRAAVDQDDEHTQVLARGARRSLEEKLNPARDFRYPPRESTCFDDE
jgi:hypothetical protein